MDDHLKKEIKQQIKGHLNRGGSVRIVCPSCNGGSSREKCMAVLNSDKGTWFQCFRANCGAKGFLNGTVSFGVGKALHKNRTPSSKLTIAALPEEAYQYLPVQHTSIPPMWESRLHMVLYPVLSYWGTELGYVQRHYYGLNNWWSGPKAINILHDTESTEPFLHFPLLTRENFSGSLVIVEDWPSAEAVAKHHPSCALLGTNLTEGDIGHMLKIGVKHLVITLDADATAKAARMKRKVALLFDKVDVVFVDKDPKDMSDTQLKETFT